MANQLEITLDIIFHATEDAKKIFEPIFDLFQIKEEEFTQEKTTGYFGNEIVHARMTLTKRRAVEFVKRLVSKVSKTQLDEILENLEESGDTSLFLRIGKGELTRRIISLQQNDAIKIRIKVPVYKKSEIIKTYTELLNA